MVFGGVITSGYGNIRWYEYEGTENDSQGIGREMEKVAKRMGSTNGHIMMVKFDAEKFKLIDHLLKKLTSHYFYYSCDTIVKNNTILGLITENLVGKQF